MPPCLTVAIASKLQSPLAGAFREGLDLAVVAVAAAVEDAFLDACLLAPLGDQLSHPLGLVHARHRLELVLGPGDGRERVAPDVVDQLRLDAAVRAKDRKARALAGAPDLGAHTAAPPEAAAAGGGAHARLPTFLATYSPW